MKDAEKFEQLTASIFEALRSNPKYESIEHNILMKGKDGPRQIDVLLRGKAGPFDVLTIIECKDHNKNLSVEYIDQLHSKMEDVGANQGVMVARKGFSKHAKRKAKRLGIKLCTAHESKNDKWSIQQKFPVIIEQIYPIDVILKFNAKFSNSSFHINDLININGTNLTKLIEDKWNKNLIPIDENKETQTWEPSGLKLPNIIPTADKENEEITKYVITFKVAKNYYFGYLDELESTKVLKYIDDTQFTSVIFNQSDILNYQEKFSLFKSINEIPNVDSVHIKGKAVRQLKFLALKEIPLT